MGEQYTICDPRMAAGYSADEKAKLLSGTAKREFHRFQPRSPRSVVETAVIIRALRALDPPVGHESAGKSRNRADDTFSAILRWFTQALSAGFRRALGAAQILAPCGYLSDKIGHDWSGVGQGFCPGAAKPCYARASAVGESPQPAMAFTPENQVRTGLPAGGSRIRTLGPSRAMSPEKVETRRYSGRCVPNVDLQIAVWKRPAAVRDFAVSDTRSSSIPSVSPCPRLRGDRAPTRNGCDKPPQHWSPSHVRGYRRRDD